MPASFSPDNYAELWIASPWSVPAHPLRPTQDPRPSRDSNYLDVWARLKPGVSLEQARAEMNAIASRLEKEYPNDLLDEGVSVVPMHEELVSGLRPLLFILLGAVTCLLLIGCANVANLQLARAASPRARGFHSCGARCEPHPFDSTIAHGKSASRAPRRHPRGVARGLGDPGSACPQPSGHSAASRRSVLIGPCSGSASVFPF